MKIGKICVLHKRQLEVEWKIPDLDKLAQENNTCYWSPGHFFFAGEKWNLLIWPNGCEDRNTLGHVDMSLCISASRCSPIDVAFTFSLRNVNGQKDLEKMGYGRFDESFYQRSVDKFISRLEYTKRQSEFLNSGSLTVVCTLKRHNEDGMFKCCYCNETFDLQEVSHTDKCKIKCPNCLDVVVLKKWQDHECKMSSRAKAFEKMIQNYKTLMLTGDHSDVVVKVKDVEFKLHKGILATQNPYFDAMFKNDMKEKSTGIVNIEDCDPGIFRSFISFLYTGKVDELSSDIVCELYEAADKYQADQLKKECLNYLLSSFSVDNFCDYILLILKYDEKELFQKATKFFICNQEKITRTVQWQTFVEEHPMQASLIKFSNFLPSK